DLPAPVLALLVRHHGVLENLAALALEAAPAAGGAQRLEDAAVLPGRVVSRAGGAQRGPLRRRAVAVNALDLDAGADLLRKLGVAVDVLDEMTIDTVHALFQVNVHQVDRNAVLAAPSRVHGRHQLRGIRVLDLVAAVVEQVTLAVLLEDGTEDPAVAVEV